MYVNIFYTSKKKERSIVYKMAEENGYPMKLLKKYKQYYIRKNKTKMIT